MGDWNVGLETLSEVALHKLADMLNNSNCGWRKLAKAVTDQPQFCYRYQRFLFWLCMKSFPLCSEKELTSCSLQVLSAKGSPGRYLLTLLTHSRCSLTFLLKCLRKIEHHEAVNFLTTCGKRTNSPTPVRMHRHSLMVPIEITGHPQSVQVPEGGCVMLSCRAVGPLGLTYQWFKRVEEVPGGNTPELILNSIGPAQEGHYICRVNVGEKWTFSKWAHVRLLHSRAATDKVALLIGNMNYLHHRQLKAPMADVYELTNLLRQLDFKVVSLLDLNWHEMHRAVSEFLLLLGRGVYGLLYYAGHGYENYGNSFMVPIDAPASYTSEHCLWVQDVLQRMQERQTGLNVFLLDMCRKRNLNDNIIQQPGPLKVTANIVFGYATCVDAEAFEVYKDDLSNGIFMSFLKKRLMEQEKVTVVLDRVAEDMGRCELTRGRQALELRSNLSERRALTDPIQAPDCPVMASTRNLQWAIAHVLPESRVLHFDCGVKVQLGFAAEFSNIMIIYTRILKKPKGICCSAQLSDFTEGPETDLKHTNQESLRDAGSLLLSMDDWLPQEQPRLYTRLSALQRLKRDLSFTVCLHYQYSSLDEEVQERQTVTVGKPLVSKLNLHERLLLHTPSSPSASAEFHMHSMPESFAEEMMAELPSLESSMTESTESYDNTQGVFSSSSGAKRNEPEENISPEFLMLKEPIVSKSLSHADADKPFKFSNFHSF
ncbi:hypothetical protein P4O66_013105 [Electrophorus voltai]|uniref:MALT paracaspase 2 n=1 Tax=Electrophorus voltai TaxID=2609070 RepID=A0AAD8ZVS2_9TELE|nr:hypothetical protein P4O66_013105 [Electrophorus voltai]